MEKVIAVLCILAMSVTAGHGYYEFTGQDPPGFSEENDDDSQLSDIKSVTVPPEKLRDSIQYDHFIHIEFKYENKTSGEWGLWILDVEGQELITNYGTKTVFDGYRGDHSALYTRRELLGFFTLFADSDDGEPITSDGDYDVQRDEYIDLSEEKFILTDSNANLSVDQLQTTNIPLSFRAAMRSYFDVHAPKVETLDEDIWKQGQTINVDDTGEWEDETSWNDLVYEWKAERGRIISGYDTVFVNVSTDFGNENFSVPFREYLYLSNDVPVPVQQYIATNTSWDGEEEAGYILLVNDFILQVDGYYEGNAPIPWGDCSKLHWRNEHPQAEFEPWDNTRMPLSGTGFEQSSFDAKPEEAVAWLLDPSNTESEGLRDFLKDYPDAIISQANYNASLDITDTDGHAGEFWWNLTFGEERYDGESRWDMEKRYTVLVYLEREWDMVGIPPEKEYTETYSVHYENGPRRGSSPLADFEIASETVTMASSEKIFKTEQMVIDNFYSLGSIELDELDWGDGDETSYVLNTGSGEQGGGMDLIATLTGIQTQTFAKYFWYIEKEDLFEGGTYASASLDAESGRLITMVEVEGTALQNALNLGG